MLDMHHIVARFQSAQKGGAVFCAAIAATATIGNDASLPPAKDLGVTVEGQVERWHTKAFVKRTVENGQPGYHVLHAIRCIALQRFCDEFLQPRRLWRNENHPLTGAQSLDDIVNQSPDLSAEQFGRRKQAFWQEMNPEAVFGGVYVAGVGQWRRIAVLFPERKGWRKRCRIGQEHIPERMFVVAEIHQCVRSRQSHQFVPAEIGAREGCWQFACIDLLAAARFRLLIKFGCVLRQQERLAEDNRRPWRQMVQQCTSISGLLRKNGANSARPSKRSPFLM
jgi:hypothetical protein